MMSRTTPDNPGHHGGWRAVTRQTLQKEAEETQVVPGITEDSNSQMETSGKIMKHPSKQQETCCFTVLSFGRHYT